MGSLPRQAWGGFGQPGDRPYFYVSPLHNSSAERGCLAATNLVFFGTLILFVGLYLILFIFRSTHVSIYLFGGGADFYVFPQPTLFFFLGGGGVVTWSTGGGGASLRGSNTSPEARDPGHAVLQAQGAAQRRGARGGLLLGGAVHRVGWG